MGTRYGHGQAGTEAQVEEVRTTEETADTSLGWVSRSARKGILISGRAWCPMRPKRGLAGQIPASWVGRYSILSCDTPPADAVWILDPCMAAGLIDTRPYRGF
jgi:hypothetical protein